MMANDKQTTMKQDWESKYIITAGDGGIFVVPHYLDATGVRVVDYDNAMPIKDFILEKLEEAERRGRYEVAEAVNKIRPGVKYRREFDTEVINNINEQIDAVGAYVLKVMTGSQDGKR